MSWEKWGKKIKTCMLEQLLFKTIKSHYNHKNLLKPLKSSELVFK